MSRHLHLAALAGALLLAGCVTVPTAPAVQAMPGTGKSFDQFRAEDVACRDFAQNSLGPGAEQAAQNAAVSNAAVATALGAAVGALIGAGAGWHGSEAGYGAAIGAGSGLLVGSAAGANSAAYSSAGMQRRYDMAYLQCMYAKGNQVPMRPGYGRRYGPPRGYGPPPYGPPPYGPPPESPQGPPPTG